MTTLIDDLVPDELWALVEPLLPAPPRPPYGGRHRVIPTVTASPRSCTWPPPRPRGACSLSESSMFELVVSSRSGLAASSRRRPRLVSDLPAGRPVPG